MKTKEFTPVPNISNQKINQCAICGHSGTDVNKTLPFWLGGYGNIARPICDDREKCISRTDLNK